VALTEIDKRVLEQCLQRRSGAWQDFVDRFIGLFVHVIQHTAHARSVPLNPADIEDFCADIFVEILNNDFAVLRNFRGKCSLATYLTVVARRVTVREMIKRRQSEALGHVSHQHPESVAHHESVPRIDDVEEVEALLKHLPEREARIFRMYHLDGRSYQEISRSLGIPENSIGPTLARSRDKLKSLKVADTA
jgi:RNA polymerase sigma-70 factor (ECF subfamily)